MHVRNHQKNMQSVRDVLNLLTNMADPELTPVVHEDRRNVRRSRVFPVLLTPWEDGVPAVDDSVYALTKDISEQGVAIVLQAPYRVKTSVIGFVVPSLDKPEERTAPCFLLGDVRQTVPLGGGYWQLGVEFSELLSVKQHPRLEQLILPAKVVSKVTCTNLLRKGNMY